MYGVGEEADYLPFNLEIQLFNFEKRIRKIITPNVGLEPTTLRLRVSCSTD